VVKRILANHLYMRSLAVFGAILLSFWLSGCSIFGAPTILDETKGWSVQRLYEEAQLLMRNGEYDKAIKYFETLESRYPHGKYATQAQLEIAYAYYKKQDPVLCIAAADRFIKLHPNHPNIDYAYYIKGLASFNERGVIEKLTQQDISDRDPKAMRVSFLSLKELMTRFPESRYAKDTTQRMVYLLNALGENELHVARYYMKRAAYVAAINRCKYAIENYPDSTAIEEALVIMISAYDALKMDDLKADTLRVLKTNYPESRMFIKGAPTEEKSWWKFWESL
jgi:outer membrane protein assembly factor BamD